MTDLKLLISAVALLGAVLGGYTLVAELWLDQRGQRIGHATYHLRGKGGFSLMKWQGTKAKMDSVIDELLGAKS